MAFYAIGLPEAFQEMFAFDRVEEWSVDFAHVVSQGLADSWHDVVHPVLFFERVPVGARTHGGDSGAHFNSESIQ